MAFTVDHNDTGFKPIEAGEYEVFPTVFESKIAQTSGNKMVVFNYKIREDVDQPNGGQEIRFDNFVDTDSARWRCNAASKAAGLEHGKSYESIDEWAQDFKGKAIRLVVGLRTADNGKTYPEVKSFKPSQVGGSMVADNDPFRNDGKPIEINDDDLPF